MSVLEVTLMLDLDDLNVVFFFAILLICEVVIEIVVIYATVTDLVLYEKKLLLFTIQRVICQSLGSVS
jgi:hypothetical protein